MADNIKAFQGPYRWLSNFAPCVVELDGAQYPSVEHAYQAAKTLDLQRRQEIAKARTPGEAKRVGRHVYIRRGWMNMRVDVMRGLLRQKYSKPPYAELLDNTDGAEIVEGNNWGDTFWGVCRGEGANTLGNLIMGIRAERRRERSI